jgi:hypothetical protein
MYARAVPWVHGFLLIVATDAPSDDAVQARAEDPEGKVALVRGPGPRGDDGEDDAEGGCLGERAGQACPPGAGAPVPLPGVSEEEQGAPGPGPARGPI